MVIFYENRWTDQSPLIDIIGSPVTEGEATWTVKINQEYLYYTSGPNITCEVYFGGTGGTPVWEAEPRYVGGGHHFEVPRSMWLSIRFESTAALPITVAGTVTSSFSGLPLTFALVDLNGKTDNTDADGKYELVYDAPFSSMITVSLAGYVTFVDALTTEPTGTTTYDVQLEPVTTPPTNGDGEPEPPPAGQASLYVYSDPNGAKIFLGPTDTGEVTPHTFTLDPGSYGVGFQLEGYLSGFHSITLDAGDSKTAFHAFEQPSAAVVPPEQTFPHTPPGHWTVDAQEWHNDLLKILPADRFPSSLELADATYKVFNEKSPETGANYIPSPEEYHLWAPVVEIGLLFLPGFGELAAARFGASGVTKGMSGAARLSAAVESEGALALSSREVLYNGITKSPAATKSLWTVIKADFRAHPLFTLLGASFLFTQMDVLGWGFGLFPESIHRRGETITKVLQGDLIRLNDLIKGERWEDASDLVPKIRETLDSARANLSGAPATFWENFGFTTDDLSDIFDTLEASLNAYISKYPVLTVPITEIPEVLPGTVTEVIDGDTIMLDDIYRVRFLGIDAHEIGTKAGQVERDTLASWIADKEVTVYSDLHDQVDSYGRLLGVVVLGGENINLKMLKTFGEYILPASKYRDRNKYVDWNENELVAKSMEIPVAQPVATPIAEDVGSLNVTSSPTYAEIRINNVPTGLLTAETIENIPVGTYSIMVVKDEYDPQTHSVDIVKGKRTEINVKLEKAPEVEEPAKVTRAVVEDFYKRGVIEEATARTYLADLGYLPADVDRFISLWNTEMQAAPPTAPSVTTGRVWITSYPYYAKIYLDGVDTGQITAETITGIPEGMHTIQLEVSGWYFEPIVFSISAGEKKEFSVTGTYTG